MTRTSEIDALFKLSLAEFTAARNALASRLKKEGRSGEAERVKAMPKPPATAWAVNQLFWRHRRVARLSRSARKCPGSTLGLGLRVFARVSAGTATGTNEARRGILREGMGFSGCDAKVPIHLWSVAAWGRRTSIHRRAPHRDLEPLGFYGLTSLWTAVCSSRKGAAVPREAKEKRRGRPTRRGAANDAISARRR